MLRNRVLLALAFAALTACAFPSPAPAPGALRVHGVPGQGVLFLDGTERGPVQAVQLFPDLAPGVYALELRRDGAPVFLQAFEVRSGLVLDVRVDAPPARVASAAPPAAMPLPSPANSPTAAPPEPPALEPAPLEPPAETAASDAVPDAAPVAVPVAVPEPERPAETADAPAARRDAARDDRRPPASRGDRAPTPRAREDELEALMARTLEEEAAARPVDVRASAEPEIPSREDVQRVIAELAPAVRACMQGRSGTATVELHVAGATGRVTSANVAGMFSGTPIGACIARTARGARFPSFRRPTYSISLPFRG